MMHQCHLHGDRPVRFLGYSVDDCPACLQKQRDDHIRSIVREELQNLSPRTPKRAKRGKGRRVT